MINNEADEVTKELFDSLKYRNENNLESIKASEFVFNYLHLLYYKCHKINLNWRGSHIDSKNKKRTINPINKKDNKCFQYPVIVTLNHEKVREEPQEITKIKLFINKCNSEGINFLSEKADWKNLK